MRGAIEFAVGVATDLSRVQRVRPRQRDCSEIQKTGTIVLWPENCTCTI